MMFDIFLQIYWDALNIQSFQSQYRLYNITTRPTADEGPVFMSFNIFAKYGSFYTNNVWQIRVVGQLNKIMYR